MTVTADKNMGSECSNARPTRECAAKAYPPSPYPYPYPYPDVSDVGASSAVYSHRTVVSLMYVAGSTTVDGEVEAETEAEVEVEVDSDEEPEEVESVRCITQFTPVRSLKSPTNAMRSAVLAEIMVELASVARGGGETVMATGVPNRLEEPILARRMFILWGPGGRPCRWQRTSVTSAEEVETEVADVFRAV
jgi:hypothetical protein